MLMIEFQTMAFVFLVILSNSLWALSKISFFWTNHIAFGEAKEGEFAQGKLMMEFQVEVMIFLTVRSSNRKWASWETHYT